MTHKQLNDIKVEAVGMVEKANLKPAGVEVDYAHNAVWIRFPINDYEKQGFGMVEQYFDLKYLMNRSVLPTMRKVQGKS